MTMHRFDAGELGRAMMRANLHDFRSNVEALCALESDARISPEQCAETIGRLAEELRRSRVSLGLALGRPGRPGRWERLDP